MSEIDSLVERSTESLKHDAELQREAAAELRSHLEAAVAERQGRGETAEDAERQAVQCFGDPEAIGKSLLEANYRRMKFRARTRLAVKVLFLPMLLLAVFIAVDWRSVGTFAMMSNPGRGDGIFSPDSVLSAMVDIDKEWKNARIQDVSPERVSFDLPARKADFDRYIFPDSVLRAVCLSNAVTNCKPEGRTLLTAELHRAIAAEPDNALYDYLLAGMELDGSLKFTHSGKPAPEIEALDRARLDRAMAWIHSGLEKPRFEPGAGKLLERRLSAMGRAKNFSELIRQISIGGGTLLPHCNYMRDIGSATSFYAGLRAGEGAAEDSRYYLNAYKKLNAQWNENAFTLVEAWTIAAIGKIGAEQALALAIPDDRAEAERQLALVADVRANFDKRREETDDANLRLIKNHAGLLAGMLLPALGGEIQKADLMPDLKLSYNLIDLSTLAAMSVIWGAVVLVLTLFWLIFYRKRARLILLNRREYGVFFLLGVFLPLAFFLVLTRVDWIGGRDYSLNSNLLRLIFQCVWLMFFVPLWGCAVFRRILRRHLSRSGSGNLSPHQVLGNQLPILAFILLFSGILLRPWLDAEQRDWILADRQFVVEERATFSAVESHAVDWLKTENGRVYAELLKTPIRPAVSTPSDVSL